MEVNRQTVLEGLLKLVSGQASKEDTGWWAYDILLEKNSLFHQMLKRGRNLSAVQGNSLAGLEV